MAKNRFKRTVSDLDAQSIESFLNGDNSYNTYSEESYIDPVLGQEAVDILSDADTDHGTALMHTMEALNEANMILNSLEHYINVRNLKIKMCNAFSKASKAKGYGIEAIDFWRSLEFHSENNDYYDNLKEPESDKKNKSDDTWYKNAWEAIKAFLKKIILAVINFIKTIGNFIKGALCKAQDLFYKKYAKDIKANIGRYKAESGNADLKIKMRAVSENQIWDEGAPWELLKMYSSSMTSHYAQLQNSFLSASEEEMKKVGSALASEIAKNLLDGNDSFSKKMKESMGKWFPPIKKIVYLGVYGKENPSKIDVKILDLFEKHNNTLDILSPAALTQMTFAFKTAQQANKSLSTCLKHAEKMAKQSTKFASGDSKIGGKSSIEASRDAQRLLQVMTSILITLYGECLSVRMKVFSAAKKLYKKGDYGDETK